MTREANAARSIDSRSARVGKALVGVLLIVVGILCMVAPKVSGRASVVALGVLLALSGLIELFAGARDPGRYRGMLMGGGVFSVVIGAMLVARPLVGMAALTLLLAGFFFAAGLFPLVVALADRASGWAWEVVFGAISIVLGVAALARWPVSSLWLIGTLVGIEIVVRGGTLLASAHELTPPTRTPSIRPA
jgi:uncharacterized membrane protein HdeD (DUF308 family)